MKSWSLKLAISDYDDDYDDDNDYDYDNNYYSSIIFVVAVVVVVIYDQQMIFAKILKMCLTGLTILA